MKKERGGGGRGGSSPSCNASHRLLAANNVLPTSVPTQFKHARIPAATYLQAQGLHGGGILARSFHQLLHRPRPEHKGREGGEQDAGAVHPAQGWEGVQDHLHSAQRLACADHGHWIVHYQGRVTVPSSAVFLTVACSCTGLERGTGLPAQRLAGSRYCIRWAEGRCSVLLHRSPAHRLARSAPWMNYFYGIIAVQLAFFLNPKSLNPEPYSVLLHAPCTGLWQCTR